jgi:hypothetical protein
MPESIMRTTHPARLYARLLFALPCLLAATACLRGRAERQEASAEEAEVARAFVASATPAGFAELLRARYGAERACLDRRFPEAIILSPGDSSRRARMTDEEYTRPYEVLRAVGLVARDEVQPGERDWRLPVKGHVDSGGLHRVVRYSLAEGARRDAERKDAGGNQRLCYARPRLIAVDSIIAHEPSPGWSPDEGVRYSQAVVFVGHLVAFDSVAPWVRDVVERDSMSDFGELNPRLLHGPQHRWAEFWVRNGDWIYAGIRTTTPR